MKGNNIARIAAILLFASIVPGLSLFADEPEDIFPYFLFALVESHSELGTLEMPEVEFLTVPGMDDAAYMITFKSAKDAERFMTAVQEENIPNGTFPDDKLRILLFNSDLLGYIMDFLKE